jgi:hypothetical protein
VRRLSGVGKWGSVDVRVLAGWNGYAYAGDDPVNAMDPTGMCLCILHRVTVYLSDPLNALGAGTTAVGISCAIGGALSAGVLWVACGITAATAGVLIASAQLARHPSAKGGAGFGSSITGWACGIAAVAARAGSTARAAYNACAALSTRIGIGSS